MPHSITAAGTQKSIDNFLKVVNAITVVNDALLPLEYVNPTS